MAVHIVLVCSRTNDSACSIYEIFDVLQILRYFTSAGYARKELLSKDLVVKTLIACINSSDN